jgi:hypothetical protein
MSVNRPIDVSAFVTSNVLATRGLWFIPPVGNRHTPVLLVIRGR